MKDTKEKFMQIRIDSELKNKFQKILKIKSDTVSGYLTRHITKYVNDNENILITENKKQ